LFTKTKVFFCSLKLRFAPLQFPTWKLFQKLNPVDIFWLVSNAKLSWYITKKKKTNSWGFLIMYFLTNHCKIKWWIFNFFNFIIKFFLFEPKLIPNCFYFLRNGWIKMQMTKVKKKWKYRLQFWILFKKFIFFLFFFS
jgi:hypothetical protein